MMELNGVGLGLRRDFIDSFLAAKHIRTLSKLPQKTG